jgi:HD-GYP domain-containing protein (c-di-GMP phosphodiesterase class II)
MLHDIGMQHVSDELVWQPHSLSLDDYEDVKRHTVLGAQMIKQLDFYHKSSQFLTTAKEIALHHHENWDGSGYPNNISGELIPLSARIMRLVDVYDGMTSERCYKKAVDHQQALVFITEKSGLLFDPNVVTAFMQVEAKFKLLHSAVEIK